MKYIQKDAICTHVKFLIDNLPKDRHFKKARGNIFLAAAKSNNVAPRNLKYWFKKFVACKTTKTNSGQPSPYKEYDDQIHQMYTNLNLESKSTRKLLRLLSFSVIRRQVPGFKSSQSYLTRLIIRLKELRRKEEEARLRSFWFEELPQPNFYYSEGEGVIEEVNHQEEVVNYESTIFNGENQGNQEQEENKESEDNFEPLFVNPIVELDEDNENLMFFYKEEQYYSGQQWREEIQEESGRHDIFGDNGFGERDGFIDLFSPDSESD